MSTSRSIHATSGPTRWTSCRPTRPRPGGCFGWEPRVFFKDLVRIMVDADLELIGLQSPGEGAKIIEKYHGDWHRWDSQVVSMG